MSWPHVDGLQSFIRICELAEHTVALFFEHKLDDDKLSRQEFRFCCIRLCISRSKCRLRSPCCISLLRGKLDTPESNELSMPLVYVASILVKTFRVRSTRGRGHEVIVVFDLSHNVC